MRLSIITPYYNTLEETKELAKVLEPQLSNDIEWIIIDDGCHEKELDKLKAKVIHLEKNSGCAGKPRNIGLDNATGDYIAFIDSDDLVSSDYIYQLREKMIKNPDMIYISWRSSQHNVIANNKLPNWNCAVWCRVYRKDIIGDRRFNETMKIAEDWVFNKGIHPYYVKSIKNQIYFYNIRENSLTREGKND